MTWTIEKTKDRRVPDFPVTLWMVHQDGPNAQAVCCYDEKMAELVCTALNEKEARS